MSQPYVMATRFVLIAACAASALACVEDETLGLAGHRPRATATLDDAGGSGTAAGATSVDGRTASNRASESAGLDASPALPASADAGAPAPNGSTLASRFVAVGYDGRRAMSLDGRTWTHDTREGSGNVDGPQLFRDIQYAGGLFVAVGGGCAGGCKGRITTTTDGVTWAEAAPKEADNWLGGVAFGNGVWVTVGGFARVLRSSDGKAWSATDVADGSLRHIRFANGWFVAVGDGGRRRRSQDGLQWVDATSGGAGLQSLAYGNGVWVAAGHGGRRVRSVDNGATWIDDQTSDNTGSVLFAAGRFIATAEGGAVLTSTDGATWTSNGGSGAYGIAYGTIGGQGRYVGFAWASTRRASDDGLVWRTVVADDGSSAFGSVAFGP